MRERNSPGRMSVLVRIVLSAVQEHEGVICSLHTVQKVPVTLLIVFRPQKCKSNSNYLFLGNARVIVIVFQIISRTMQV